MRDERGTVQLYAVSMLQGKADADWYRAARCEVDIEGEKRGEWLSDLSLELEISQRCSPMEAGSTNCRK